MIINNPFYFVHINATNSSSFLDDHVFSNNKGNFVLFILLKLGHSDPVSAKNRNFGKLFKICINWNLRSRIVCDNAYCDLFCGMGQFCAKIFGIEKF
jgi:hypothetical protein